MKEFMSDIPFPWRKERLDHNVGTVDGSALESRLGKGDGQLWATGKGTLIGAFIGGRLGKSLDRVDMMYHKQAVVQAQSAPLHQTIGWHNDENGHSGSVTPLREGSQSISGTVCREFKQEIVIDGQSESAKATACQNTDSSWTVMK